jgi:sulfur-carrier protein adenylyltransferase/sulfurtransferase
MSTLQRIRLIAGVTLEQVLQQHFPDTRRLSLALMLRLFRQASDDYDAGWSLTLPTSGRRVCILKPVSYPEHLVDVYAIRPRGPRPPLHMSDRGKLCLAQGTPAHHPDYHTVASLELIAKADRLLSRRFEEVADDEWQNEIHAYWPTDTLSIPVISLLTSDGVSRSIATTLLNDKLVVVADDAVQVEQWLDRRVGRRGRWATQRGVLLWTDRLPTEPWRIGSVESLYGLDPHAAELLQDILHEQPSHVVVVIGHGCGAQTLLLGVILVAMPLPNEQVARAPHGRDQRMPRQWRGIRSLVMRADPTWITYRGGALDTRPVQHASIAMLGCGSLGGGVTELLARTGVSRLTLIDPDILTFENIGRHILGARAVGMNKAVALKEQIETSLPHISCEAIPASWTTIEGRLHEFDLVISTMAVWQQNVLLNHVSIDQSIRPVLYAWLEPHALAAHAVGIINASSCLACGFTLDGRPKLTVHEWSEDTLQFDAGCGGMVQPYGAIDLVPAQALTAEFAVDMLAHRVEGSVRRTWVGSAERLAALGGAYSDDWEQLMGSIASDRRQVQTPWQADSECPVCHRS